LIPFQFKTTDTYMLEFGNLYMRVMRNHAHVLETAVNITGITKANPGVVTAVAHGFSNGDDVYVTGVVGMTQVNGRFFRVGSVTANTFTLLHQVDGANINTSSYTTYSSAGTVARLYTLTTPYATADLDQLKYVQSADVMTITHKTYGARELTRTGHAAWTLTEPTFAPAQTWPTAESMTVVGADNNVTYRYQVTAIAEETFEESLPGLNTTTGTITGITQANPAVVTVVAHGYANGEQVYLSGIVGMTELNGRRFDVAGVTANTFQLVGENSTSYTAYSSAGSVNATFVKTVDGTTAPNNTVSWTAATSAQKYAVYRESNGIFGFIGETEDTTFTDNNIAVDLDLTPPRARNPFRVAGDYPGAVSYFEQRRVFGGSTNKPDTSYYSKTGNHSNFSVSSPSQSDDAITATLNSLEVNEIRHYVPGNDLIVLTSGSEWRINSGSDAAFEAATLKQKPQSYWGCSHLKPYVAGTAILFVEDSQARVRSLGYSLQIDGYTGTDMTLLAGHLFQTYTIEDWCYAHSPDPRAYFVRSDGQIACMTIQQEQEVIAWSRWDTLGKFERVAVLHHSSTEMDNVIYVVAKRTIDGKTVRYIERTVSRRFTEVQDCFFVDSGLSLDSPIDITDATEANPVVITATAHGFSNGDEVDINGIVWASDFDEDDNETQPDQLNGGRFTVANATANTFELSGEDGSAFNAYVEGGEVRKAVTSITGLNHLEGRAVAVLADGNVISGHTVSGGAITLVRKASRVHVGLKYIADIETLNIETPSGTIQGEKTKISEVTIRFERSRGLYVGPSSDKLVEMKQREFEVMGAPTSLLTGDKTVTLSPDWSSNGRIFMRQRYPLPMTILAVIPDVTLPDGMGKQDE
jgi:hypothetical protein